MSFKIIETQEQLDAIISERIARAKDATRKEFEGWISPDEVNAKTSALTDKVSTLESALNSANEELNAAKALVAERDKTIKGHVLQTEKTRIAHEMGLSYDAINFLQGDDVDAIKASAEILKNLVGANNTLPLANHEQKSKDSKTEALKEVVTNLRKD